ncbi:hypothetical protein DL93DRAFT_2086601 [Clavulina sp. PMI_390]|nr:hypothetical protein DL93DRAFT_2086601 [Clavulina sp. PMI_390]
MDPPPERVISSSSYIETLPAEVLGEIFESTAGPKDTHQIHHILQVSSLWRSVALSRSCLFTHADWTMWHPELIKLWCSRAKLHPLSINLCSDSLIALAHGIDQQNFPYHRRSPEYCTALIELLSAAVSNAESLQIVSENYDEFVAIRSIFENGLPNLQVLKLKREPYWSERITLNCPNLRALSVSGLVLDCKTPLTHLEVLEHENLPSWGVSYSWLELCGAVLTSIPALRELYLSITAYSIITPPVHRIPSLRKLTLSHLEDEDYNSSSIFRSMLENLDIPDLEELRFRDGFRNTDRHGFEDLFKALPQSLLHLEIGPGLLSDIVAFPLMVIGHLLSDGGPPHLACLDCRLDDVWPYELPDALDAPERVDLERALIELSSERKTLRNQYGVDVEAEIIHPIMS